MAGLYIHIPFCKSRCSYCDFYSTIVTNLIPSYIKSLEKELILRSKYLDNQIINSIYIGGGTPSLLNSSDFSNIFDKIFSQYSVANDAEITLEANPDDLKEEYLNQLKSFPFNRLSIGIQSFDDNDLKRINRRHSAKQALEAISNARKAEFENISIDLIYGLPFQDLKAWKKQLETALKLDVNHISAYGLTWERKTQLWEQYKKGEIQPVDDDIANEMFLLLRSELIQHGFEAYEISNYARPGYRSRHNSAYWKQQPYLGAGPSAHSYNLNSRQWNIASIKDYIRCINEGKEFYIKEELNLTEKYNDYVMVSLRTSEGISREILINQFGTELEQYFMENATPHVKNGKIILSGDNLCFSTEGILVSDSILVDLMKV